MSEGYQVVGGSLTCSCGLKYHVSIFRDVLEAVAREAHDLALLDRDKIVALAIERGYQKGHMLERFLEP